MNENTALPFLRPMRVAELLDATIRLYRKNFLTFVAIVAVIQVPLLVINGALSIPMAQTAEEISSFSPYSFDPETFDPEAPPAFPFPRGFGRYFMWLGIQYLVALTLGVTGNGLMTGALAWAVSERHLGRSISVGRAYWAVFRRWKSLLGATFLVLAISLAFVIAFFVPCLGQVVVLPLGLFAYACLRFVPQAVMLEGCRAGQALRRSWYLAKPHLWRVLGIVALLWLFGTLVTAGPSYVVNFGTGALETSYLLRLLVASVVSAVLSLLYVPIRLTGETLVYYDLRVRAEGLDLEMEMDALTRATEAEFSPAAGEAEPALPTAPPADEPFLSRRDWRNLAILVGVGLGLLLLCCVAYLGLTALLAILLRSNMGSLIDSLPTLTPVP